jgi:hypothetical protein
MKNTNSTARYSLASSEIAPDGAVILILSAQAPDQARWGRVRRCQPGFPDYGFWRWVLDHKDRWPETVSDEDVSKMRREYEMHGA